MRSRWLPYLVILLGAALLFLPFLGRVHLFDWDEINFAECAREMIVTKDYLRVQIDFLPFWEKPPLFIWLQVLSMKLFGINEYAARFPNAVMGIVTLLSLYHIGRRTAGETLARWWVALYAATWLPHFYFKSGIIDPTFNFFIFVAFYQMYLVRHGRRSTGHALLAGAFIGLAVLTKGPVAILIALLSFGGYLILNRGWKGYKITHLLLVAVAALLVTASWFSVEVIGHGWGLVKEFIDYQVGLFSQNIADHQEPWYYHPIVLLVGCFPTSVLLFQYFRRNPSAEGEQTRDFTRWMWILFWVVLILFSIVKTKIVHYSSLCYFPMTYLAALQLSRLVRQPKQLGRGVWILMLALGSLLAVAIALLPVAGIYKEVLIAHMQDPFAAGNLQAPVPWHWAECTWGLLYLAGIWISVLLLRRRFRQGMVLLCALQVLIIQITVLHFTPKIEAYSQRAVIDFFKSFRGRDVYVQVLGYKSYAHLFYTAKKEPLNPAYYRQKRTITAAGDTVNTREPNEEWLLRGLVDQPAYFTCKVSDTADYDTIPTLARMGQQNGFVFYKRK